MNRRAFIEETCVFYDSSDNVVGRALAYASLTPPFLVVMYAALSLVVRDTLVLWAFAGQLLGALITAIAKRIIDQSRPDESEVGGGGMPSNHSQFVCFFAVFYMMCFAYKCPGLVPAFKALYSCGLAVLAGTVTLSRVYLKYHTLNQALVGAALGCVLGYCWYRAYFLSPMQQLLLTLCRTPLFRWLRIKCVQELHYPPALDDNKMT